MSTFQAINVDQAWAQLRPFVQDLARTYESDPSDPAKRLRWNGINALFLIDLHAQVQARFIVSTLYLEVWFERLNAMAGSANFELLNHFKKFAPAAWKVTPVHSQGTIWWRIDGAEKPMLPVALAQKIVEKLEEYLQEYKQHYRS